MTTINHYINRYKTDKEFKYDVKYIAAGTVFSGILLYSLTFIFTTIGFIMQ